MALPTAEEITNWYLYGMENTPDGYASRLMLLT